MVLGHLTVTCALQGQLEKRLPGLGLDRLGALVFGAFLPDLIDKPLHLLFAAPTRGFGHSAVLIALVFYILIRLLPKYSKFLIPIAVGMALHLIEDIADLHVILWPLLDTWQAEEKRDFVLFTYRYYFKLEAPLPFFLEVASYPFFLRTILMRTVLKRKSLPEPLLDNEVSSVQT